MMLPRPETLSHDIDELVDFAHHLANEAGRVILPHFRTRAQADHKGGHGFDPVTAADRGAEEVIRRLLAERFPQHGVIGEEFPDTNEGAAEAWVVDPIDGTRAFVMGLPVWGTLIGFIREGRPVFGLFDQPYTGERLWSDGEGAYFRGPLGLVRCNTRDCADLGEAMLAATTPDMFNADEYARFAALAGRVRMRRFGGDCYAYAMLALGKIDLVVEASLKVYDIAPLIPVIEQSGGIVTSWEGRDATRGGRVIAAGDKALHAKALEILNTPAA